MFCSSFFLFKMTVAPYLIHIWQILSFNFLNQIVTGFFDCFLNLMESPDSVFNFIWNSIILDFIFVKPLNLRKVPSMFQGCFSISQIALSCDNIVVHTKVWHEIVLVMLVLVSLKFLWSNCLGIYHTFWEY